MKKILITLIFGITVMLLFPSCSVLLSKIYGVEELKSFNEKEYNNFVTHLVEKYDLSSIISDTIQYKNIIKQGRSSKEKNNLGQPVQILYFDDNMIKSYHANCYAKGSLSNLNWNTEDRFSVFPPKSAILSDSLAINLEDYIDIYPNITIQKDKKYTIVIFWTQMLSKVSKAAIETVFFNIKKFKKEKETLVTLINISRQMNKSA